MAKETLTTRVAQLEEAQLRLTNALSHLVELQAKNETEMQGMRKETEQLRQDVLKREARLDERIDKLVSAVGDLISHMSPGSRPGTT